MSGRAGGRHRASDGPDGADPTRVGAPPTPSWLESICARCAGAGWLPDPHWQVWLEQRRWLHEAAARAAGDVEADVIRKRLLTHEAGPPSGPRHHRCPGCSGAGTVPTEEGSRLLEFLQRHGDLG